MLGLGADSEDAEDPVESDDAGFAEASEEAGLASPLGAAFVSAGLESEELADFGA